MSWLQMGGRGSKNFFDNTIDIDRERRKNANRLGKNIKV
jgi:hypothetical protein